MVSRRFSVFSCVALLAFSLGCSQKTVTTNDNKAPITKSLTKEDSEKVLARVGTRTITLGEFAAAVEHMDPLQRMRYQTPDGRKQLLREMVQTEMLASEAIDRGYDKDPVVEQELRAKVRDVVLSELRATLPGPEAVPMAEVQKYYDEHKDDFLDPERRRLSVIVFKTEAEANAALEQLKVKAGEKPDAVLWGKLVKAKSIGPGRSESLPDDLAGDVGFVASPSAGTRGANNRVPEEVRTAAFQVPNVGEAFPKVVKAHELIRNTLEPGKKEAAEDRFYLLRIVQKDAEKMRVLGEAEASIRNVLVQQKMREKERAFVEELKKKVAISIDDAVLQTVKLPTETSGIAAPSSHPASSGNPAPSAKPTPSSAASK